MAPTGDPSTFTFTFDAFPASNDGQTNVLFDLIIGEDTFTGDLTDQTPDINDDGEKLTYILIDGTEYYSGVNNPDIVVDSNGDISIEGTVELALGADQIITDLVAKFQVGDTGSFSTQKGVINKFYII